MRGQERSIATSVISIIFAMKLGVGAVDAPAAIAKLKEEGCIYTRKDEFGWKIGLKVGFVEKLKFC